MPKLFNFQTDTPISGLRVFRAIQVPYVSECSRGRNGVRYRRRPAFSSRDWKVIIFKKLPTSTGFARSGIGNYATSLISLVDHSFDCIRNIFRMRRRRGSSLTSTWELTSTVDRSACFPWRVVPGREISALPPSFLLQIRPSHLNRP